MDSIIQKKACDAKGIRVVEPSRDRPFKARFPLHLRLEFLSLTGPVCTGHGDTLNISSEEVRFASSESFTPGQMIQASMDWPARLDRRVPLRLVVSGRVLRSNKGLAVMTIKTFEFRIRRADDSRRPPIALAIGA